MHKKIELISKRNSVFRVLIDGRTVIRKEFTNEEDMLKELKYLNALAGTKCKTPKIEEIEDKTIIMEDLGEINLLDWFEELEKIGSDNGIKELIEKLVAWYESFYDVLHSKLGGKWQKYDVNFRNFIIVDDEIYGIDFEQTQEGNCEEDIGKIAAFALMYNPENTDWKKHFVSILIKMFSERFNIPSDIIITAMKKELHNMEIRRNNQI